MSLDTEVFPFRIITNSLGGSNRVVMAQVRGVGVDGQDDQAEPGDDCEVLHPLGFMSRATIPANGNAVTMIGVRVGNDIIGLGVRDKSMPALTDSDLADGDAVMYSPGAPGSTVKMAANGDVTATVKSGQVFTVDVNGAQLKIDANGAITLAAASGQSLTASASNGQAVIGTSGQVTITAASGQNASLTGTDVVLNSGSTPVAKEGSMLQGTAGPYPIVGIVQVGAGSPTVLVP